MFDYTHDSISTSQSPRWREVSPKSPCPICGRDGWCTISADGVWAICRRLDTGSGKGKIDKAGAEYWVYRTDGQPLSAPLVEVPPSVEAEKG